MGWRPGANSKTDILQHTLLQRKANRQKEEKSHGRENSLCFMNSCLSWFGHPERKHGPGQPEIFPRDSYHLSEKSRLKNRPGARNYHLSG